MTKTMMQMSDEIRNAGARLSSGSVKNKTFLDKTDERTRNQILDSIASHYGITKQEAYDEVTATDAEHLLEYLTGSVRSAVSVLMQKMGLK